MVCGPTAVGKTKNSIELAKYFDAEIISADARQIYKEISIGTAKPSDEELKEVRHHLISQVSVAEIYNAGLFEKQAVELANALFEKNKYVVVCGGSGLYIHALCHGFDELPEANAQLRMDLNELYENSGIEALQERLKKTDPLIFGQIDINNPRRLMRAIEICELSGKFNSHLKNQTKKEKNFSILKIGFEMDRNELYEKINQRVDEMMEAGLLAEAEKMYPLRKLNALQTVGYNELFNFFDGHGTLENAIDKIKQHTRNYAKRQMTWFRKDQEVKWFHPSENRKVIEYIKSMSK